MKSYPISMSRRSYRGSDASKRSKVQEFNRVATRVEDYLNGDLARQSEHSVNTYLSYSIASDIGEDSDLVHEVVFATDCGSNGITILKGDYERAMAGLGSPPTSPGDEEGR